MYNAEGKHSRIYCVWQLLESSTSSFSADACAWYIFTDSHSLQLLRYSLIQNFIPLTALRDGLLFESQGALTDSRLSYRTVKTHESSY